MKGLELVIQVIFFQMVFYILGCIKGSYPFSIKHFVAKFLPQNWFVILYVVMWILSPYMNIVIEHVGEKIGAFVLCLFLLFSVYTTAVDSLAELFGINTTGLSSIGMYGSELGYTIVNFVLMYFIGAYLRLKPHKLKVGSNFALLIICNAAIWVWGVLELKKGLMIEAVAWEYCNPLVIISAALTFMFFKNQLNFNNGYVNSLARASFTCYLIHHAFYKYINIEKYVNSGVLMMLLHIIVTGILVYICSFIAWKIYYLLSRPLINKLKALFNKINIESYLYPHAEQCKE